MVSNIWVAAADNQVEIVQSHIDSGAFSANSKDPNGYTPIHAAASYGHILLLKYLIEKGGDINIQDTEGDTPLHHVEDLKTAKYIVEELNANYKIKNNDNQTPAAYIEEENEFPDIAQYLISLAHGQPAATAAAEQNAFIESLPRPGNVDGHEIRYTLENETEEDAPVDDEERRKKIEAILNSENPEEALRDLVTSAVREGFANYNQQQQQDEPSLKKRKD